MCCWRRRYRNCDGFIVTEENVADIANWGPDKAGKVEVPFMPGRVVLQDFTGVPAWSTWPRCATAMVRMGGDPKKINPLVPCDLVIDHSVQVDEFATELAHEERRPGIPAQPSNDTSSSSGARRRSTISASCRLPRASCIR